MEKHRRSVWLLSVVMVLSLLFVISAGFSFGSKKKIKMPSPWPPQMQRSFPDLELLDQDGKRWNLSRFKGKIIIVEPIGMNCPACQSWSGAFIKGAYGNIRPQKGLKDFKSLFKSYTRGLNLTDDGIVMIQLLLYDLTMGQPTAKDAKGWAKHFGFHSRNDHYVVIPTQDMRNKPSFDMIPGFYLIDKKFKLRSDSTGHNPKDNLYTKLLPMVPRLLFEGKRR